MREIMCGAFGLVAGYTIGRGILTRIDDATREEGTSAGMKVLFSERNVHIKTDWEGNKEETQSLVQNPDKATILVANHPNTLEPLLFLSELPPRKNLSLIAKSGGERIYKKAFRQKMIPVDTKPYWETKRQKQKRQAKNDRQIDEAIRRLKNNEAILIAPDGGDGTGTWKKGSARLLEAGLSMPEAYLIMAHVPGSTPKEHWRLAFKRRLERTVYISKAIPLAELPIPQSLKSLPTGDKEKLLTTSAIMKSYYDKWVEERGEKNTGNVFPKNFL